MAETLTPRRRLTRPKKVESKAESKNGTSTKYEMSTQPQDRKLENAPTSPELEAEKKLETDFEKRIGFSAASMKPLFEAAAHGKLKKDAKGKDHVIVKLCELLKDNTTDARRHGLRLWKPNAAVDEAYNVSFQQINPTLIRKIRAGDKAITSDEICKELERWGIPEHHLFTELRDGKGKVRDKILSEETFTNIKVPIVKSVVNAREARLFSERDVEPFMSFEPVNTTEEWEVVGEIITKIVSEMGAAFGYKNTFRGLNHSALKYSHAFLFPQESWYSEIDSDGEEKEGLRYFVGGSTRVGYDQSHRPNSFNTDTGCEWGCSWRVRKWSDVDRNPAYYNKDKVSYGTTNWFGGAWEAFFKEVYPCTMELPLHTQRKDVGIGAAASDEAKFYSSNDYDKAIFETNMYRKLSPKEWGLSEYKPKVWVRFVIGSDGAIMYAEPLPYCPILYLGTDADDVNSNTVPSFALDALPWQDLIGNVLSQIVVAMRANAVKVVFYDKYQLTEDKIVEMMARAKASVNVQFFPMDWKDLIRGQVNIDLLFKAFTFPQQNIGEMIATLNTAFNVMERGLGISGQEMGAIAGHTQTKGEVDIVAQNQGSRLGLYMSMGDDFFDAWKRQIWRAIQAFRDDDFDVEVSVVPEEVRKKLEAEEFGFKFKSIGKDTMRVNGKKSKLAVNKFLSTRDGHTRQKNPQLAQVMFQSIGQLAGTELAQKVGAEQIIRMWNHALQLAGVPDYGKWTIDPASSTLAENKKLFEEMQAHAKEIAAAASKMAVGEAGKQIAPALEKLSQGIQQADKAAEAAGAVATHAQGGVQLSQQETEQLAHGLAQLVLKINAIQQAIMGNPAPQMPPEIPPATAMMPA